MWIVCDCGERVLLAKHLGGAWGVFSREAKLDAFFEEHFVCDGTPGKHYGDDIDARGRKFQIAYESDAEPGSNSSA